MLNFLGGLLDNPGRAVGIDPERIDPAQRNAYRGMVLSAAFNSLGGGTPMHEAMMSMRQGMDERTKADMQAQMQQDINAELMGAMTGPAAGQGVGPGQGGGAASGNPNQIKAQALRRAAMRIAGVNPDVAKKYFDMAEAIDPRPEYFDLKEGVDAQGNPIYVQGSKSGGLQTLTGALPKPDIPSEVRAVEYLTGNKLGGTGEAGMNMVGVYNRNKATNVTQINKGPENKAIDKVYETVGAQLPELSAQARQAALTNQGLQTLMEVSDRGTFTGALAPGAIGASQFFESMGFPVGADKLANSRAFQAASNMLVLDFMAAMGGARGFSKEESAILYDAFPKIIDSPEARRQIATLLMRRNNRVIGDFNEAKRLLEEGTGVPLNILGNPQPGTLPQPSISNAAQQELERRRRNGGAR